MRDALRAVPSLYWFALVWIALALWAKDGRGVYIAMACLAIGTVQFLRNTSPDP